MTIVIMTIIECLLYQALCSEFLISIKKFYEAVSIIHFSKDPGSQRG